MYALNVEILCMNQTSFRPQAEILQRYLTYKTKNLLRSAAHNVVILSFTGLKPAAAGIFSISLPTDGPLPVPSPRRALPACPVLYDGRFFLPAIGLYAAFFHDHLISRCHFCGRKVSISHFLIIVHNATKNTRIFHRVFWIAVLRNSYGKLTHIHLCIVAAFRHQLVMGSLLHHVAVL